MKYPVGTRLVFTLAPATRWTVRSYEHNSYFLSPDGLDPVGFSQTNVEGLYWHTEEEYAIIAGLFANQTNPFVKPPKKKARCINP